VIPQKLFTEREIILALGLAGMLEPNELRQALARLNIEAPLGAEFGNKEATVLQDKSEWFIRGLSSGWIDLCPLKQGTARVLNEEGGSDGGEGPLPQAETDGKRPQGQG